MKEAYIDNNASSTLKISRYVAQAEYKAITTEVIAKDGTKRTRNAVTLNDEKIADTCMQFFQESNVAKRINYHNIREKAEEELAEKFIECGLIISPENTKQANREIEKKQELAIAKYVKEYILENFDTSFKVSFDEFINLTGVKSAKRFSYGLDMILNLQQKNFFEWEEETISDDYSTIQRKISRVSLLSSIAIVLDAKKTEGIEDFKTISGFRKSKIRNKSQYIEYIRLELSADYISSVVGLGRNFAVSDRRIRNQFKIAYTFKLDWLIRSIIKIQHNRTINYYTIDKLQRLFGTSYARTSHFLKDVLKPSIEEINNLSELKVETINHKEGSKIIAISFKISTNYEKVRALREGVSEVAYYIASRLYYFSSEKIDSIIGFANHIDKVIYNSTRTSKGTIKEVYGGREMQEWEKESNDATIAEKELRALLSEHSSFFEEEDIFYDSGRMCLMKKALVSSSLDYSVPNLFSDSQLGSQADSQSKELLDEEEKAEEGFKKEETVYIHNEEKQRVDNPILSLAYAKSLLEKNLIDKNLSVQKEVKSIYDYLPFKILLEDDSVNKSFWITVDNEEKFDKYSELIKILLFSKRVNFFSFESEFVREQFVSDVVSENLIEVKELLKEKMKSISAL